MAQSGHAERISARVLIRVARIFLLHAFAFSRNDRSATANVGFAQLCGKLE